MNGTYQCVRSHFCIRTLVLLCKFSENRSVLIVVWFIQRGEKAFPLLQSTKSRAIIITPSERMPSLHPERLTPLARHRLSCLYWLTCKARQSAMRLRSICAFSRSSFVPFAIRVARASWSTSASFLFAYFFVIHSSIFTFTDYLPNPRALEKSEGWKGKNNPQG